MTLTASEVLAQLSVLRMQAEATALSLRALETAVKETIAAEHAKQGAVHAASSTVDCKCPPNRRQAASTPEHPQRTICSMCNKEHNV